MTRSGCPDNRCAVSPNTARSTLHALGGFLFSLLRSGEWWRIPAFLAWMPLFFAGYFPEWTYHWLRDVGGVVTQRALINNHYAITLASAGYILFFTYRRCRDAGDDAANAQGKALQLGVAGLLAFLPMRIEYLPDYFAIPVPEQRRLLLFFAAAKTATWLYLFSIVLRYYVWSGERVFQKMRPLFPSLKHPGEETDASQSPVQPPPRENACPGSLAPPGENEPHE